MKPKMLLVLAAVAGAGYVAFTGKQEEAARTAALPDIAGTLGLEYIGAVTPKDISGVPFPVLADAADLQSENLMSGKLGNADIRVADIDYRLDTANNEIAGNENPNRFQETVIVISDSTMELPDIVIRPTNKLQVKAGEAFEIAKEKTEEAVAVIDDNYGAEIRRVGGQIEVKYAEIREQVGQAVTQVGEAAKGAASEASKKVDPKVKDAVTGVKEKGQQVIADLKPKVQEMLVAVDPKLRELYSDVVNFLPEMPVLDMDFPDHPEFSDKYVLTGANVEAVGASLSAETLDYLGGIEALSVEARGNEFIMYRTGKLADEAGLGTMVAEAKKLHELLNADQ